MASLEQQANGGNYRVIFWFDGRKFSRTLKTSNEQEAISAVQRIEENIRLVERGRLEIPADADVATFLLSDGKLDKKPVLPTTLKLDDFLTKYRQQLPHDSLEPFHGNIACWFIDTDYNEESFFVRHAYFLGANDPYSALKTTLRGRCRSRILRS